MGTAGESKSKDKQKKTVKKTSKKTTNSSQKKRSRGSGVEDFHQEMLLKREENKRKEKERLAQLEDEKLRLTQRNENYLFRKRLFDDYTEYKAKGMSDETIVSVFPEMKTFVTSLPVGKRMTSPESSESSDDEALLSTEV